MEAVMNTPSLPNPDTLSDVGSSATISSFDTAAKVRRKRRVRRRKKRGLRGIPAWLVFYTTAIFMGYILYRGYTLGWVAPAKRILVQSLLSVSILVGAAVLFVDDKWSFSWSKSMRRSYEVRTNLTKGEAILLYILIVLSIIVLAMRIGEYVMYYIPNM